MNLSLFKKNAFIAFFISILISIYIGLTFLAWAVTSKPYDLYIRIFTIIIIFFLLLKIRDLIKSKNNILYLLITLTYIIIVLSTLINSPSSIKINVICEQLIWLFSPVLLIEFSTNKLPLKIVIISFLVINFIFGLSTFILFYFNEIKHIYDLPVLTTSGPFLRVSGYYNEHNANGLTNLIALFTSLWLASSTKKLYIKFTLLIPMILSSFLIISSGSRASLLAVAVAIAYTIFALCPKKFRVIFAFFAAITVILSLYFIIDFRDPTITENIIDDSNTFKKIIDTISSGRYTIWEEAIKMGNIHPIIGNGAGTMANNALLNFGESSVIYKIGLQDAHNTYINTYYNSGIFCTISFTSLVVLTLFLILFDRKMNQLSAKNIFLCFVVLSLLDLVILYTITLFNIFFWIFLIYIWKYRKIDFIYIKASN